MIDLHYWPTPTATRSRCFLEEAGLAYTLRPVNIGAGEQFRPEFLAIAPNNRMPAIVDQAPADGGAPVSIFELAILVYLAEKTGRFLPDDLRGRANVLQWLFWQMAGSARWLDRTIISRSTPRKDPVCAGPVRERDQSPLRRARPATRASRIHRRRIFDRRHGLVPWIVPHKRQGRTSTISRISSAGSKP